MAGDDTRVRLAAFTFLEEPRQLSANAGVLRRQDLVRGFVYEG